MASVCCVCGNKRCESKEKNSSQHECSHTFYSFHKCRFLIRSNVDDSSFHLFHVSTKAGSKWKRSKRYFFRKVNESIPIILVSILFKHFQNGSVTGNLSIITHFFQCVPDKRIEPIYYPSKIHQITGNSIFVLIVLQFVQQHISHIGFVVIRDQMNRQINTWFQKSHNNRGFQKCSTVNRDISVNSHFLQTSMI